MPKKFVGMSRQHENPPRIIILLILSMILGSVAGLTSTSLRHSGFYVDNGQDQTMIHQLTTRREKNALEHEILKLLGLPEKPKNENGRAPLMKRSAPKFLLNIYENTLEDGPVSGRINSSDDKAEFYLTGSDLRTINESDVIITFSAQQKHQGGKPDKVKRIWFDVGAAMSKEERMISAELRLFRGPDAKSRKYRGAFEITVYRVLRTINDEREMQLVDMINTTVGQEGWLTLNVTESLDYWMKNPDDNRGLYISVYPVDHSFHQTRPEDIGIVGFKGDAERQPFMVGFFESPLLTRLRMTDQPFVEGLEMDNVRSRRSEDIKDVRDLLKNHYHSNFVQFNNRPCRIHTLYVSFKDLNWQDWIIAPEGYDAFYCGGECKFPLNGHLNVTNHAIIQTLVHLLHPSEVPKPCCVPTKLSPISVLYFLDDNNVILKKYKNMAVRDCGCH